MSRFQDRPKGLALGLEFNQKGGLEMAQKVYSYSRFSTPEQAAGDSERRQYDAAKKYADENGLVFDESLRMTDRGLSGYHGVHRKKGALGAFLEKVKSGEVPKGSILVVENIDRLGREEVVEALETIVFGLIKHGITIRTTNPEGEYTRESLRSHGIYKLIVDIERAHGESDRKSELGRATWTHKRKQARKGMTVLTSRAPAWLRLVDGRFEVIPEAAEAVRMVFDLRLQGFGKGRIERKMNESAPWFPPMNPKRKSEGWRGSYIEKILGSRAVLGEFQPHRMVNRKRVPDGEPIQGYFPAIVPPETFHAVQEKSDRTKNPGGRTSKAKNVFKNLTRCGYCGGAMVLIDKGKEPKGGVYLVCDNGRRKVKCHAHAVRYKEFQDAVLSNCSKLRPDHVLPASGEQAEVSKRLRLAVSGMAGELADAGKQIENFLDQIGKTSSESIRGRYEQRIADLEARQSDLKREIDQKEKELRTLEQGKKSFENWRTGLAGLMEAIGEDMDARIRLNAHLKDFIEQVDIFAKGHAEDVDHVEELIADEIPELAASPALAGFKEYVAKRILSPEGRCYRVRFRGARDGAFIQLAPADSLAGRVEIRGKKWSFKAPALDQLADEYFDSRKPGFQPKPTKGGVPAYP